MERYSLDPDGCFNIRHTYHTIRAIEDGVDLYIFNHEPQATHIEVLHGGALGQLHIYGGGLLGREIHLATPLVKTQTTALEYRTHFSPALPYPNEVRRAAYGRSENIDLAVEFHSEKRPHAVWWCVWDDHLEGGLVHEDRVGFESGTARRYVPFIEETSVGFRWEW